MDENHNHIIKKSELKDYKYEIHEIIGSEISYVDHRNSNISKVLREVLYKEM